jgi:hypothetical protein
VLVKRIESTMYACKACEEDQEHHALGKKIENTMHACRTCEKDQEH